MNRSIKQVLIEALIIGLVTIVTGNIAVYLTSFMNLKPDMPQICDSWNKFYVLENSLFMTGILTHLFFEYSPYGNLNKLYCRTFF